MNNEFFLSLNSKIEQNIFLNLSFLSLGQYFADFDGSKNDLLDY